jgi:hypothetical protein
MATVDIGRTARNTAPEYRSALDAAVREYESLTAQRAEIDTRIAQLAQAIGNLTRLCGLVPSVPWGLTDACRMALKAAGHPLTAMEVRAQLEAMGFDLSRYVNELAAIHTILGRLQDSGSVELVATGWDKPAYSWKPGAVKTVVVSQAEAEAIKAGAEIGTFTGDARTRTAPKRAPRRKR